MLMWKGWCTLQNDVNSNSILCEVDCCHEELQIDFFDNVSATLLTTPNSCHSFVDTYWGKHNVCIVSDNIKCVFTDDGGEDHHAKDQGGEDDDDDVKLTRSRRIFGPVLFICQ